MELRHLKYFVVVAEELSFTRAAKALNISQPPLSQQIGQLEAELGTRLFHRTSRSVALTEAGRTLLPEAQRMLDHAEDFRRIARTGDETVRLAPPLRLGSVSSGYSDLLPRVLPRFRSRHPGTALLLSWADPADQIRDLRAGRIDIGLIRTDGRDIDGLRQHIVEVQPFMIALPEGHPLASRAVVSVSDLADEELILLPRPRNPHYVDAIIEACRRSGFSPKVSYQPEDDQVLLGLVAAGLGVGIIPGCVKSLSMKSVTYRDFSNPQPTTTLCWAESEETPSRYFNELCSLGDAREGRGTPSQSPP